MTLTKKYKDLLNDKLSKQFNYSSIMQVPKLEKVVINAGVGDATNDAKLIESMFNELTLITGQKPIKTKAKKAIATYKLREQQEIGVKVTLHGENMWNFVEKLIKIALPRVRDFKGLNFNSFDGKGNYTFGVKEQIIFTEINYDDVKKIRGFDVTFVTSAKNNEQAKAMLIAIGLPFNKKQMQQEMAKEAK